MNRFFILDAGCGAVARGKTPAGGEEAGGVPGGVTGGVPSACF